MTWQFIVSLRNDGAYGEYVARFMELKGEEGGAVVALLATVSYP